MLITSCFQKIIRGRQLELIKMRFQLCSPNYQLLTKQLIIGCCCLFLLSCGELKESGAIVIPQKEMLASDLELRANEGLVYHLHQPFSGYSIKHYPNDTLAEKIAYIQGKKEGLYQKWYPTGVLSFESNYQKGRKHGVSRTWWKNGALRSESYHLMGVTNGNQKQWYKSGQLFKSMNIVDGKEEGIQQAWRENGKIYNNYEAKNGRIFGLKRANLCYELEEELVQY